MVDELRCRLAKHQHHAIDIAKRKVLQATTDQDLAELILNSN